MRIGIVGAGKIGSTLADLFGKLGHHVEIANSRGPETLHEVEQSTGARAATVEQAVRDKDLVVLTIPMKAVKALPPDLFAGVPASVPVIDTCNYYPRERDGRIEPIEQGMAESRWVSQRIGHATIKAFNNITFRRLASDGRPKGAPDRVALPVSGDDGGAKAKVMALVEQMGFEAIDNGSLDDSWRQQPGSPSYLHNADVATVKRQLADASPVRQPQFSGSADSPGSRENPR